MLVPDQIQILVCTEPIDMRKGANSLAGIVRDALLEEPLSGKLFVFQGKHGDSKRREAAGTSNSAAKTADELRCPLSLAFWTLSPVGLLADA